MFEFFSLLAACRPDPREHASGPDHESGAPTESPSSQTPGPTSTGDTGDTTGGLPAYDCERLPAGPFPVTVYDIQTTEDFDFDGLGNLVYSDGYGTLLAADIYSNQSIIGTVFGDTRGIQVLSTGDIAALLFDADALALTDRQTGGSSILLANLRSPNALEVGDDDLVFVSEVAWDEIARPRVISFDPSTGQTEEIAQGFTYPNGLALNQAQDVLFVADLDRGLYKIAKDTGGAWQRPEIVFTPAGNETLDAIETDICGNVYVVQFQNGLLYRLDRDTLVGEVIMDLELDYVERDVWNAIRWGSGRGGWRRDVLYVTDRSKVIGVEIGVPGRSQPIDQLPAR